MAAAPPWRSIRRIAPFDELTAADVLPIWEGVCARAVVGKEMTFSVVELDPDAVVAEHRHPNEQAGMVVSGSMSFTIGGEERQILPGAMYMIPGNVPHRAVAGPDGAVVIDVFSPPRDDWNAFEPLEPREPRWP